MPDATEKFYCPCCNAPEAAAGYLGWRDCGACGWEEKHPTALVPVAPSDEPKP